MKVQFKILLFLVCLNLATGMVIALALPGTEYASATSAGGNVSDYESRFNSTKIAESWEATPFSGIPVVGDVFAGFYLFFTQIRFIIDGFPSLLQWISDAYITSSAGRTAFAVVANTLRAIYAVMMAAFLVYLITGRDI